MCAVTEATKALNKYDFKNTLTITSSNVTFAKNLNGTYLDSATAIGAPTELRFVKVTLSPQPVNTTFSALVLGNTQNISATATADLSVGLSMNKFYTAYAFIESPALPLVRGQAYALDAKGYNDTSPNSLSSGDPVRYMSINSRSSATNVANASRMVGCLKRHV